MKCCLCSNNLTEIKDTFYNAYFNCTKLLTIKFCQQHKLTSLPEPCVSAEGLKRNSWNNTVPSLLATRNLFSNLPVAFTD